MMSSVFTTTPKARHVAISGKEIGRYGKLYVLHDDWGTTHSHVGIDMLLYGVLLPSQAREKGQASISYHLGVAGN